MELPPIPDEEQRIVEDEGGSGNPTQNNAEGSPAQAIQLPPANELQSDGEDLTNSISPSRQRLLDKAEEAHKAIRSIEARIPGAAEELLRSRSSTAQRMMDAIEARRNRSAVERLLGAAAEDERKIRSTWEQRILEASEPLRNLSSSIQMALKAGGVFPPMPLDHEQILKLANLSIGVGQSLSSVLSKVQESSLLKSVGELEKFRDLQAVVHPPLASLGAFNVDSVARLSPASLGFSKALFSEIQQYTGNLGAGFSKAVAEMERVAEVWEEWDRQMDLHADRLGELGWTYPMNLTAHELSQIIQCSDAGKLDEEFVEFYNYNNGEYFGELCEEITNSDHLTPWHAMLTECVESHKDQRFIVSATCLIAALEGAITKRYGGRLKKLTEFFNIRIQEAGEDQMEAAMWKSIAAFIKQLFANSDFSGDAPARINRHWILHGKAVPTGTEADSLRLFQAIHTVSVIYDSLNPKHSA
jgi:hypothetical protein